MRSFFGIACVCTVLTAITVADMYVKRGGLAFGGEWLIAPLLAGLYDIIATFNRK